MNYNDLDRHDKEMIRKVANGTITGLKAFEKTYFAKNKFTYDLDLINRNKEKDYNKNKKTIDLYLTYKKIQFKGESTRALIMNELGQPVDSYTRDEIDKCKEVLEDIEVTKSDFTENIMINNKNYSINTLDDAIYFKETKDIEKLKQFMEILHYLSDNDYITFKTLKKEYHCSSIVFNKVDDPALSGGKSKSLENSVPISNIIKTNTPNPKSSRYVYKNNDKYYSPEYLHVDEDLKKICKNFYNQYFAINDMLHVFINNDFKPLPLAEQTRYKKTSTRAWIAIGISILIGIGSIITSIFSIKTSNINFKNNTDFWDKNEIAEITAMDDINKNLEEIQINLETISANQSDSKNVKLTEKLDELIDLLTKYVEETPNNTQLP